METNDSILKEIKKYSAHIDRFESASKHSMVSGCLLLPLDAGGN